MAWEEMESTEMSWNELKKMEEDVVPMRSIFPLSIVLVLFQNVINSIIVE